MKSKQPTLKFCILMDLAGITTFIIPGFGELADIFWAPVSAITFIFCFKGRYGLYGGMFNFIEEFLPGTDFIPTFTIRWMMQYSKKLKMDKALRLSN